MLDVSEREECVMALYLLIWAIKINSVLEPVPRCEPSFARYILLSRDVTNRRSAIMEVLEDEPINQPVAR